MLASTKSSMSPTRILNYFDGKKHDNISLSSLLGSGILQSYSSTRKDGGNNMEIFNKSTLSGSIDANVYCNNEKHSYSIPTFRLP